MFYTHENGKSSLPTALFNPDEHCWTHVSLDIWSPWFLVTVETTYGDDGTWISTLFLHNEEQLDELIQRTDRKLIRIQVVQPLKDKRRGWQLEDVVGISKVSLTDSEDFIELALANGEIFTSIDDDDPEINTINVQQKTILWPT